MRLTFEYMYCKFVICLKKKNVPILPSPELPSQGMTTAVKQMVRAKKDAFSSQSLRSSAHDTSLGWFSRRFWKHSKGNASRSAAWGRTTSKIKTRRRMLRDRCLLLLPEKPESFHETIQPERSHWASMFSMVKGRRRSTRSTAGCAFSLFLVEQKPAFPAIPL